jgi:hemerythrin-like metal-binding protein
MDIFEWNDNKMSLGIKLIDEQHKELLNIINLLANSISNSSQKEDILDIVDKLIDYASYHFKTEEELFDKFNYTQRKHHTNEHNDFAKKFIDLRAEVIDGEYYKEESPINIAEDMFDFLTYWLINHILYEDRNFVELFKEKGIK